MKNILLLGLFSLMLTSSRAYGQNFPIGDHWYNNPLGFDPVKLHTMNGFLIPAAIVGICLLVTDDDSLLQQRISFYNESGVSWGYKYPYSTIFQNNTGIEFFLRSWMSIGTDLGVYITRDDFNSTGGIAVRPFARFYAVSNKNWKLYAESGGGFIYFLQEFPKPTDQDPRLGTNLNGTTRYGVGGEIAITEQTEIMLGVRHVHVSNGNTKGIERNPSHDSNGMFIGFSYKPYKGL